VRDVGDAEFGEVVELSRTVPVIVEFYAEGVAPAMPAIVRSYGGRLALATVDGNRSPQVAGAFQVQQVPAVVALVGGRPVNLFAGMPAEAEVRQVLDQVLELAAQNGVTGTVSHEPEAEADGADAEEPVEQPLPPLHQEAYDAISRGDLASAEAAYRAAIAQSPADGDAVAGLAQVGLLQRLEGREAAEIREVAAADPDNADAQLAVADLDLSGGHVDDAFARLLGLYPTLDEEGKTDVRTRLLDYFEIVGATDERTIAARRAFTNLLY
jgi:putative thioredoxin